MISNTTLSVVSSLNHDAWTDKGVKMDDKNVEYWKWPDQNIENGL